MKYACNYLNHHSGLLWISKKICEYFEYLKLVLHKELLVDKTNTKLMLFCGKQELEKYIFQ